MWIEVFIVVVVGLCFGSLNTLLIYRLPLSKPVGMVRSACPVCRTPLRAADLLPLFSWLLTRGRCRHCHAAVHWRYPVTELVTALVFLLVWRFHGLTPEGALIALLGSQLLVLCVIDFEHRIIPDALQVTIGATGVAYGVMTTMHLSEMLGGMLVGALIGLVLQYGFRYATGKDGLGTGDVKFMAAAGIWLGLSPLVTFLFYSGVLGVASALLWRMIHPDPRFPFGPALALSLFLLVMYPASALWFQTISVWIVTALGLI